MEYTLQRMLSGRHCFLLGQPATISSVAGPRAQITSSDYVARCTWHVANRVMQRDGYFGSSDVDIRMRSE